LLFLARAAALFCFFPKPHSLPAFIAPCRTGIRKKAEDITKYLTGPRKTTKKKGTINNKKQLQRRITGPRSPTQIHTLHFTAYGDQEITDQRPTSDLPLHAA
jgi:hypothetical protein